MFVDFLPAVAASSYIQECLCQEKVHCLARLKFNFIYKYYTLNPLFFFVSLFIFWHLNKTPGSVTAGQLYCINTDTLDAELAKELNYLLKDVI